jgi:hypothetical protein
MLPLSLRNSALRYEGVYGSRGIGPRILDYDTSWSSVVNFTAWPLYFRSKCPHYTLDRRLSGPHSWSGRRGEERNLAPTGTHTPTHNLSPTAFYVFLNQWLNLNAIKCELWHCYCSCLSVCISSLCRPVYDEGSFDTSRTWEELTFQNTMTGNSKPNKSYISGELRI